MKKLYILITDTDCDQTMERFDTLEDAQTRMKAEFLDALRLEYDPENKEGWELYEFQSWSAWINADYAWCDMDCTWHIWELEV